MGLNLARDPHISQISGAEKKIRKPKTFLVEILGREIFSGREIFFTPKLFFHLFFVVRSITVDRYLRERF